MNSATGYSGTPLLKKLGIKPGMKYFAINAPQELHEWLGELPEKAQIVTQASPPLTAVHMFVNEKSELVRLLKKVSGHVGVGRIYLGFVAQKSFQSNHRHY